MMTLTKSLGEELVQVLFGKKIQIKDKGRKYTGRVIEVSYSEGLIYLRLDNNPRTFILNGDSYMKIIK